MFALYFFPPYLLTRGILRNVYYIAGSVISIVFIGWFLFKGRKNAEKHSKIMLSLITLFYVILCISTVKNNGPYTALIAQSVIAIGFSTCVIYYFTPQKRILSLRTLVFWLEICVVINLMTILVFPNGLYQVYGYTQAYSNPGYFLGHKNNAIEFLIPLIGCSSYLNILKGKTTSYNYKLILIISSTTALLTWSGNEILCIAAVVMCDILLILKGKVGWMKIPVMYLISLIISALLVFMDLLSYVAGILQSVLNKSGTVFARARFWQRAMVSIIQRPWLGSGVETSEVKYLKIGHPNSCHNYFLDYLYYGGILLLAVITGMIVMLSSKLKDANEYVKAKTAIIFLSYFVLWIGTPIHRDQLFFMFGFFMITICIDWKNLKTFSKPFLKLK